MSEKATFSIRLEREKRDQLDRLAERMDRPRSYLVGQAIDAYLAYHAWKLERVAEGAAAADRGELVEQDDVFGELRGRYRAKAR